MIQCLTSQLEQRAEHIEIRGIGAGVSVRGLRSLWLLRTGARPERLIAVEGRRQAELDGAGGLLSRRRVRRFLTGFALLRQLFEHAPAGTGLPASVLLTHLVDQKPQLLDGEQHGTSLHQAVDSCMKSLPCRLTEFAETQRINVTDQPVQRLTGR